MAGPRSPTSPKKERRQSVRFAEHPEVLDEGGRSNGEPYALFDADDDDDDFRGSTSNGARQNGSSSAHISDATKAHDEARRSSRHNGGVAGVSRDHDAYEVEGAEADGDDGTPSNVRRAYGLKSTYSSREAEFDADDSDVDAEELLTMDTSGAVRAADGIRKAARGQATPPRARNGQYRQNGNAAPESPVSPSGSGRRFGGSPFAALDRARRSISEGAAGHDLRESLRSAMESEELPDWLRKGAGILDSTWNMSNSILGAGVVGLPYSIKESGCLAGICLILGIALMTDWTIRLIVLNAKLSGRSTYIDIMDYCYGRRGRVAVSIFQGSFAFGGMCAFIVVIGDTLPHVLSSVVPALDKTFLASRWFIMIVCTLSISFPLSLYRSIESLSRASAIALISMVLIILTVIVRGPAMPADLKGDPSLRLTIIHPTNVVRSIAVISFAFVCHHNSLLIYGSLREPSMDRFGKVTHYSTAIAAIALVAMSLAGYWTFTDKTLGNVLNNFPPDDTMVNVARFCFGMNMLTTWPLELFVAREVIETYYFEGQYDQKRHVYVTVALTLASLLVSLLATDLGVVLEVTGGLSATALAFIFPSICYLRLCGQSENMSGQNAASEQGLGSSGLGYRGVPDNEEDDDDDDDAREADAALHREVHGDITVDEVELPLQPGALLRRKGTTNIGGKPTPWFLTTKPLAVMCAGFGCFVMVVSLYSTLSTVLFGSGVDPGAPALNTTVPAANGTVPIGFPGKAPLGDAIVKPPIGEAIVNPPAGGATVLKTTNVATNIAAAGVIGKVSTGQTEANNPAAIAPAVVDRLLRKTYGSA